MMGYESFRSSFRDKLSWLSEKVAFFYSTTGSDFVARVNGNDACTVNLRLLYRIAMREGYEEALKYFLCDQFISDAYDESEVAIKVRPLASTMADRIAA